MKYSGKPTAHASGIRSRILFLLSLATLLFWNLPFLIDVYSWPPLGAVFESLWLPMMVALFILPVLSMTACIRRQHVVRSVYFYSLALSLLTLALLLYRTAKGV